MSLKLSDLKSTTKSKYPDFVLDAEDEKGTAIELRFRPAYMLDDKLRAELRDTLSALDDAKDGEEDDVLRETCRASLRIAARDPYHFEVLEQYIEANTEPGDLDLPMWLTVVELYREQTHVGEA